MSTFVPCDPSRKNVTILSDNGTEYVLCNLSGVVLYAGENTSVYENPASKQPRYVVEKGKQLGKLASIIDYGTYQWLTFELKPGEIGKIVFYKPKTIADAFLKKAKVKSKSAQQDDYDDAKDEEKKDNEPWWKQLGNNFTQGAKYGMLAVGGYLVYDYVKTSKKAQSKVSGNKKSNNTLLWVAAGLFLANEAGVFQKSKPSGYSPNLPLPPIKRKIRPITKPDDGNGDLAMAGGMIGFVDDFNF